MWRERWSTFRLNKFNANYEFVPKIKLNYARNAQTHRAGIPQNVLRQRPDNCHEDKAGPERKTAIFCGSLKLKMKSQNLKMIINVNKFREGLQGSMYNDLINFITATQSELGELEAGSWKLAFYLLEGHVRGVHLSRIFGTGRETGFCFAHLRIKLAAAPPRKMENGEKASRGRKSRLLTSNLGNLLLGTLSSSHELCVDLPIPVLSPWPRPAYVSSFPSRFLRCRSWQRIRRLPLRLPANVLYSFSLFGLLRKFVNLLKGFCCQ